MFRSILEKIPSIITKTDVSSPQVKFHLIRPLSHATRSSSYAGEQLYESRKYSKKPYDRPAYYRRDENNFKRTKSKNFDEQNRNTQRGKKILCNNKPEQDSKTRIHKKHISRYNLANLDNEVISKHIDVGIYELEACRPRRSRSELTFYNANDVESLFRESLLQLQPSNLKPIQSCNALNYPLQFKPKRINTKRAIASPNEDIIEQNVIETKSNTSDSFLLEDSDNFGSPSPSLNLPSIYNNKDDSLSVNDYKDLKNKVSSSFAHRPSYSEYMSSKKAPITLSLQSRALLSTKGGSDIIHKRNLGTIQCSVQNFCNVAVDTHSKTDVKQEAVPETKVEAGMQPLVNLMQAQNEQKLVNTAQALKNCLPRKGSIHSRTTLKRLNIDEEHPLPSYSDYVKTKPNKQCVACIDPHSEIHEKLNYLSTLPQRQMLLQNIMRKSVEQKREFSSSSKKLYFVESIKDGKNAQPLKNSSYRNDYYRRSSTLSGAHFLSKSVDGLFGSHRHSLVPLLSSRTFVVCPAYSEHIKVAKNNCSSNDAESVQDINLITSKINCPEMIQKCLLSTKKSVVCNESQTMQAIASLNMFVHKRSLSTTKGSVFESNRLDLPTHQRSGVTSRSRKSKMLMGQSTYSYSKKCKPKKDPCEVEPEKPKKCFLPSTVRLKPSIKCGPRHKPCPVEQKCPPRADDCVCPKSKTLPEICSTGCICVEPYIPRKAPELKRLKFKAPDPPRVCPTPYCPQPRADDNLREKCKTLKPMKPKPCDCVEPPPLVDVPLVRLKKICEPEAVCYPPTPCLPPPPCIRADESLCIKPKELPILQAPICPCIEETYRDVPPLKRLNLKSPEPPRVCPKPCVCNVDCPRADTSLVCKVKPLPPIKAGDCPCVETELVDVNFKRLECIEEPEECFYTDPCDVQQPRADYGCWEYYTPEKEICCPERKVVSKKVCKKKKVTCRRC